MRPDLIPGHNVDRVDIEAGLKELAACGYDDPRTFMVIEHALSRHARGEEVEAQRGAIDASFYGISLTCWFRVLAASARMDGNLNETAHRLNDTPLETPTTTS